MARLADAKARTEDAPRELQHTNEALERLAATDTMDSILRVADSRLYDANTRGATA